MGRGPRVYGRAVAGAGAGGARRLPLRAPLPSSPSAADSSPELRVRKDDTFDLVAGIKCRDSAPKASQDLFAKFNCTSSDSSAQSPAASQLDDASPVFVRKKPKQRSRGIIKNHLILANKSKTGCLSNHYLVPVSFAASKTHTSLIINGLLKDLASEKADSPSRVNVSAIGRLGDSKILDKSKIKMFKNRLLPASSTPLKTIKDNSSCDEVISPIRSISRFNRDVSKNINSNSIIEKDTIQKTAFESNLKSISEYLIISIRDSVSSDSLHCTESKSYNIENEDPNCESKPSGNIAGTTSPDLFDSYSESIFVPVIQTSLLGSPRIFKIDDVESDLQDLPISVTENSSLSLSNRYKSKDEDASIERNNENEYKSYTISHLQDLEKSSSTFLNECKKNEDLSIKDICDNDTDSREKVNNLIDLPIVGTDKLSSTILDQYKNKDTSFESVVENESNLYDEKINHLEDLPIVVMDQLSSTILEQYKNKDASSESIVENESNIHDEKINHLGDLPIVVMDQLSSTLIERYKNKDASFESIVENESNIYNEKINHLGDLPVVVMDQLSSTLIERYQNKGEIPSFKVVDESELHFSEVNSSDDSIKIIENEASNFIEFKRRVTSQLTCENYFTSSIDDSKEESEASSVHSEFEIDDYLDISETDVSQFSINKSDNQIMHYSKDALKTVSNVTEEFFDNTLKNVSDTIDRQSSSDEDDQFDLDHDIKKNVLPIRKSMRLLKKRVSNFRASRVPELIYEDRSFNARLPDSTNQFRPSVVCQPGKRFERSMSIIRKMSNADATALNVSTFLNNTLQRTKAHMGRKYQESVEEIMNLQPKLDVTLMSCCSNVSIRRKSMIVLNEPRPEESTVDGDLSGILEESASQSAPSPAECMYLSFPAAPAEFSDTCDDTAIALSELSISRLDRSCSLIEREERETSSWRDLSARDIVLRKCNQTHYLPFVECYPNRKLKNCCKIGEGVYGEVFLYKNELDPAKPIVMKIIPVEGTQLINGEPQKKFDEIISEIVIAMELSNLRNNDINGTSTFNKVHQVKCVQGSYPERLLELWELFDETKGSENEHPLVFGPDQLFIVLELENGGNDLEAFVFTNAEQSFALFNQIAFGLAVSEESLQFEHRDLHWGNVLVTYTDENYIDFTLRGVVHSVRSGGISASIIDFTLSRITLPQVASTIYNDLACDEELFGASGDYQFDIYRLMRKKTCNDWQRFEPYTNVLWLHYLLSKMVAGLRYEKPRTKVHNIYMNKLKKIRSNILNYHSCADFVLGGE